MDLSFLSLDQKYVGQKYGEISGKYSLPILCFLKKCVLQTLKTPTFLCSVVARYGPLFNFSKNRSNKYGHLGNFSHSSNDFWDDQQLRSHPKSNFCKMPDDQMTYLPDHTSHLAIARNEWMLFKITEHEYLVTSGHLGYLSHLDDLSHNDHLSNFGHLGHFDAMSHLGSFK